MSKLKSKPAYSLIFAIVMMSLMMIVATGAITRTRKQKELQSDLIVANLYAKMASESGVGIAMLAIKDEVIEKLLKTDQGFAVIMEQWRITSIRESTRRLIDTAYFRIAPFIFPPF